MKIKIARAHYFFNLLRTGKKNNFLFGLQCHHRFPWCHQKNVLGDCKDGCGPRGRYNVLFIEFLCKKVMASLLCENKSSWRKQHVRITIEFGSPPAMFEATPTFDSILTVPPIFSCPVFEKGPACPVIWKGTCQLHYQVYYVDIVFLLPSIMYVKPDVVFESLFWTFEKVQQINVVKYVMKALYFF